MLAKILMLYDTDGLQLRVLLLDWSALVPIPNFCQMRLTPGCLRKAFVQSVITLRSMLGKAKLHLRSRFDRSKYLQCNVRVDVRMGQREPSNRHALRQICKKASRQWSHWLVPYGVCGSIFR